VAKEKTDPEGKKNKNETIGEDNIPENTEKVATDDVNNKGGKIKRRGKKKSNGAEEVNVDQQGGNTAKTSSQEATDTAIVKRMVGQLMKECEATNVKIDLQEIEQIVEKLESGEEVGQPGHREIDEEGEEALRRLEDAVKRKGTAARKKHAEVVEMGRGMMKGKQRKEVLEGMLVDDTNTKMLAANTNTKILADNSNTKRKELLVEKQVGSISSCGESVSEEELENRSELDSKDEDSTEDSSEDSSSEEESSSSDDDEEQGCWPQSHQYNPGGGQQQRGQHPSGFPGPSQFQNPPSHFQHPPFAAHPPFPPHQFQQNVQYQNQWQQQQANLAWYQNWCASVQLQRQQVEWQTYWAELARKPRK